MGTININGNQIGGLSANYPPGYCIRAIYAANSLEYGTTAPNAPITISKNHLLQVENGI